MSPAHPKHQRMNLPNLQRVRLAAGFYSADALMLCLYGSHAAGTACRSGVFSTDLLVVTSLTRLLQLANIAIHMGKRELVTFGSLCKQARDVAVLQIQLHCLCAFADSRTL